MFTLNDDLSIYATRGDTVFFSVTADDDGKPYVFQAGDVVRIKVYGKKDAENVVLVKDFPVTEATESVEILLTEDDTKIGEVISKHKDYWYEVELNPFNHPQTIIGYDEDGAKVFRLFPEGDDIPPYEPIKPEDIPIVDDELDMTSTRPVENQAIARAIVRLDAATDTLEKGLAEEKARFDNLISEDAAIVNQPLEYMAYITENTKAKLDATITSNGVHATIKVNFREANQFYGGSGMNVFMLPDNCRPIDVGVVHNEDDVQYSILYDTEIGRYVLGIGADANVATAPSGAGIVTFTYALADYEVKDIRVGADGVTYATAGEAVRAQFAAVNALLAQIMDAMNENRG
jgi:hypothetical protein